MLAAIVVLLFLGNLRSTVIAAIAIPTSIVATFALIWYMGFTLNMLTMLALTLSVGIVIDDAIVVLENIYRFIEEKGMPPVQAAIEATREIGLAVMATTLLAGRHLRAGRLHERHGRPLHAEFRPDHGLRGAGVAVRQLHADADDVGALAQAEGQRRESDEPRDSKHNRLFDPLDRGYTRLLEWAMAHRGLVAVGAVLVLLSSVPLFRITAVNFTPEDDQSQFDVTLRAPEGTSLAGDRSAGQPAWAPPSGAFPEVEFTLITVAGDTAGHPEHGVDAGAPASDRGARARSVRGDGRGPRSRSCRRSSRAACAWRCSRAAGPAAAAARSSSCCRGPTSGSCETYSEALRQKAAAIPGLVDVDTTLNAGKPELSVTLDRPKAADLGVQIADAAEALRLLVAGDQVTTLQRGRRAVRSAPARRGIATQHPGRGRRPAGAILAARRRDARQHRQVHAVGLAGHHQPHGRASVR